MAPILSNEKCSPQTCADIFALVSVFFGGGGLLRGCAAPSASVHCVNITDFFTCSYKVEGICRNVKCS